MAAVRVRTDIHSPLAVALVLDTDYKPMLRGFYCAAYGDVAVVNHNGDTITFRNVVPGSNIPGQFQQIKSSGTTVPLPTTNITPLQ